MTEKEAREMINNYNTADLFDEWELVCMANYKTVPVREWLLDEFRARFPEAIFKWQQDEATDEELIDYFTK